MTESIDGQNLEAREINNKIRKLSPKNDLIEIKNPQSNHYLCAGILEDIKIEINGNVGYFTGTMVENAELFIEGNAGNQTADNLISGTIEVKGHVGDGSGLGMYGGKLIIQKDAGSRTAGIMKNGEIIIRGDSDFMTGLYMMGGKVIVCGNAGRKLGESMIGGKIFVGGETESLGKNALLEELNEKDKKYLSKKKKEFNLLPEISDFQKIIPKSERPFYGSE